MKAEKIVRELLYFIRKIEMKELLYKLLEKLLYFIGKIEMTKYCKNKISLKNSTRMTKLIEVIHCY